MNITWNYSGFNVYKNYGAYTNVVYSYSYHITVSDGTNSASLNGIVRLNFADITNYIPFESLTPQTVQQWTEQSIDTAKIITNLSEAVIAKGSDTQQNLPAPWSATNSP